MFLAILNSADNIQNGGNYYLYQRDMYHVHRNTNQKWCGSYPPIRKYTYLLIRPETVSNRNDGLTEYTDIPLNHCCWHRAVLNCPSETMMLLVTLLMLLLLLLLVVVSVLMLVFIMRWQRACKVLLVLCFSSANPMYINIHEKATRKSLTAKAIVRN